MRSPATGSQDAERVTKNTRHTLRQLPREVETAEQTETRGSLAARKLYDEQVREARQEYMSILGLVRNLQRRRELECTEHQRTV